MAEIVNFNRFKKAKIRESEERQAAENRTRFGRSKIERENDRREAERRAKILADKELTGSADPGDNDQK